MDALLCVTMNYLQWQLRHEYTTPELLEAYLAKSKTLDLQEFFAAPAMEEITHHEERIFWKSPLQGKHPENNRSQTLFFPSFQNHSTAPTLILLHGLMSTGEGGYRNIAHQMNECGWNVLFPYLPFHYARKISGYPQGLPAVTADLVRNGETVRQAVQEVRQLIAWSRAHGSEKVALIGTSYGGWIASLLLAVEKIDHAILLQPIVELGHATFESPLSQVVARNLRARNVTPDYLYRHPYLSPMQIKPLAANQCIKLVGATHDKISPPRFLRECSARWPQATYHEINQGHFGFAAMRYALNLLEQKTVR